MFTCGPSLCSAFFIARLLPSREKEEIHSATAPRVCVAVSSFFSLGCFGSLLSCSFFPMTNCISSTCPRWIRPSVLGAHWALFWNDSLSPFPVHNLLSSRIFSCCCSVLSLLFVCVSRPRVLSDARLLLDRRREKKRRGTEKRPVAIGALARGVGKKRGGRAKEAAAHAQRRRTFSLGIKKIGKEKKIQDFAFTQERQA